MNLEVIEFSLFWKCDGGLAAEDSFNMLQEKQFTFDDTALRHALEDQAPCSETQALDFSLALATLRHALETETA